MRNEVRCLVAVLGLGLGLLAPPVGWGQAITPGFDLLETDPGTTFTDLSIPGGTLFGPGSAPVNERVFFRGNPLDSFDPDGVGGNPPFTGLLPTDTIVRRTVVAGPVYPAGVPIEIVELHLVSVQPIVVTGVGPGFPQFWSVSADIRVDAAGNVQPPQVVGSMTIRHEGPNGGTFDSFLPVRAELTFLRLDAPGVLGPVPAPPINFDTRNTPWCHQANPLVTPMGYSVLDVAGLTTNFFASVLCEDTLPPERLAVSYSVDGGVFNVARNGLPLTPLPNPAEGLFMPPPPHVSPNDVFALGTAPGANGYATEGEVFQGAGAPLGAPPNTTNVDRMSAALGVGPAPAGPPFLGPFAPNPGAPVPAPALPGVAGPPGSFGPPPGNTVGVLGLVPDDNIDALSYGRDSGNVLLFSVDPATTGVPFSAVNAQAVLSPFGGLAGPPLPTNPGGGDPGGEAAGDIFKSVQLLNFGSYMGLHFAMGAFIAPAVFFPNQLEIDEIDLGLQAPALNGSSLGPPEDDLDGLEMADTGDIVFGVDIAAPFAAGPDGIPDRWTFFSIDTASPTAAAGLVLPPGFEVTPDDILVTPPGGFSFDVYADGAFHIGLLLGDDLESLALSDVFTLGALDPGFDEALFSFHPGSPMVLLGCDGVPGSGDEASPADVYYTNFTVPFCPGPPVLYASAAALGLLATDNVNAIDILPAQAYPRPVRPPIPPPCPCKKMTPEQAMLAKHGIRVSEKKRDRMQSEAQIEMNTVVFGPLVAFVNSVIPMTADREAELFHPGTAMWLVPIEIVSMTLQGNVLPIGQPVIVRAGRQLGLRPTQGATNGAVPGNLFPADSFFDVFVEIELPTMGVTLHTVDPVRVRASAVRELPPFGDEFRYQAIPPDPGIEVYDQFNQFAGFITGVRHLPRCQSDAECADACKPCVQRTCDLPTGRCLESPLPDTDADGVCDAADNCPQLDNPGGQSLVIFGQTIRAQPTKTDYCWPAPADVTWVQGNLSAVSVYGTNSVTTASAVACFNDLTVPGAGSGLYYLVKPGCLAGSYQNQLGSEPRRDQLLP